MTVRINKQKINLREKLAETEEKVSFEEVVRGLGENTSSLILNKDGGNVGIGTTNAISGRLYIIGGNHYNEGITLAGRKDDGSSLTTLRFFHDDDNSAHIARGSNECISINSNGNVGIGTTDPNRKLQAHTDTNVSQTIACTSSSSSGVAISHASIGHNANKNGNLQLANSVGNNQVYLKSDGDSYLIGGNVGIGTSSLAASVKLHVEGVLRASVTDEPNAYSQFTWGGGLSRDNGGNGDIITTQPALIMNRIDQDANGERTVTIHSDNTSYFNGGNVGIGTTNPSAKLDIYTTGASAWGLKVRTDNGDADSIKLVGGGGDSDVKFVVKGGGNVGIGTANPASKLEVLSGLNHVPLRGYRETTSSGAYLIDLYSNVNGTKKLKFRVEADGDVITTGSVTSSDKRTKQDIVELEHGIEVVKNLEPKKYKMIGSPEKGFKYGFVAQDVEDILPDIVRQQGLEDGEGGYYKALEYNSMIAVLTKAIQEQQTIIEDLKSRIETLESK
jgi:hypothetical protein